MSREVKRTAAQFLNGMALAVLVGAAIGPLAAASAVFPTVAAAIAISLGLHGGPVGCRQMTLGSQGSTPPSGSHSHLAISRRISSKVFRRHDYRCRGLIGRPRNSS